MCVSLYLLAPFSEMCINWNFLSISVCLLFYQDLSALSYQEGLGTSVVPLFISQSVAWPLSQVVDLDWES